MKQCAGVGKCREDSGRLPDGRHFKLYRLIDEADGAELVAVRAEDGHRKDRRYRSIVFLP